VIVEDEPPSVDDTTEAVPKQPSQRRTQETNHWDQYENPDYELTDGDMADALADAERMFDEMMRSEPEARPPPTPEPPQPEPTPLKPPVATSATDPRDSLMVDSESDLGHIHMLVEVQRGKRFAKCGHERMDKAKTSYADEFTVWHNDVSCPTCIEVMTAPAA
jgi:hypothetical protein